MKIQITINAKEENPALQEEDSWLDVGIPAVHILV